MKQHHTQAVSLYLARMKRLWAGLLLVILANTAISQNIIRAEYFFDTDPGAGNGTLVTVTPSPNITNLNFNASIVPLSQGFHMLFVRVMDDSGRWSAPQFKPFYKYSTIISTPDIVKAEYYFNTDPGYGNGTDVPVTPGTTLDPVNFTVDISSLDQGFNFLHVRVKDAFGRWSHEQFRSLYKLVATPSQPDITQAEYFFDTDPGFGNGFSVPLSPAPNVDTLEIVADISSLSDGYHQIFVRSRDAYGRWSMTLLRSFYKLAAQSTLPDIVAAEYFIDSDPGFGQGTALNFSPGPNKVLNFIVPIPQLPRGFHTLHVRAKDGQGRWGQTTFRPFYKEFVTSGTLPKIKKVEYFIDTDPGFGMATNVALPADTSDLSMLFDIDVSNLSNGFHQLFVRAKDQRGKWSQVIHRPFYKQPFNDSIPNLTEVEYFLDSDPGPGNGINVPIPNIQNIPFLTWALDLSNVAFGQHQLFVRARDAFGKWSVTTRDTIFYYLDSLPTASLSGPFAVCINESITFDVMLTGTPPWTIIYNTGFGIDTASGIMVTPFQFSFTPTLGGTHTAKILKVQDVYYTGLYTGIPVDYEVKPDPAAAGAIGGPTNVCKGSNSVVYSVPHIANALSYEWTVPPGATITGSAWYWWGYQYIVVNFGPNAVSGNITVKGVNTCGQGAMSSISVSVHEVPTVDAGPDLFLDYGDTAFLSASPAGGTPPYSYSWGPWWLFNNNGTQNPWGIPTSHTQVSLSITDAMGCSATDYMMIYVGPPPGSTLTGLVSYNNATSTPLPGTDVMITPYYGSQPYASTTTDPDGVYVFDSIPAGWYWVSGTGSSISWGGGDATDALLMLRHFGGLEYLSGLRQTAGDVNGSGLINAIDALQTAGRFVGSISSFAAGDWKYDVKQLYSNLIGTVTTNFNGLCTGDVNGSYLEGAKTAPSVEIVESGSIRSGWQSTELPVYTTSDLKLGAVSLVLDIPDGLFVEDVRMGFENSGYLLHNVIGNQLRIAWFSMQEASLIPGVPLLWITVRHGNEPHGIFRAGIASELADPTGHAITARLSIPKISMESGSALLGENYPNPYSSITTIPLELPGDGRIRLSVLNLLGQEISLISDAEMKAGNHEISFDGSSLAAGIYQFRLRFEGRNGRQEEILRKMTIAR